MRRLLCAAILIGTLPPSAQALQPADFAFGAVIEPHGNAVVDSGSGRLYVADLPAQVYQNVARDNLSDVAVFDAKGEALPFALRRPPQSGGRIERIGLAIFPVRARSEEKVDRSAMRVTRDASGRLSEIQTEATPGRETIVSAYLIDASQVRKPVSALIVEWPQGSQADTAMVQVTLETSDNLKNWRGAGQGVLSRLSYGGRTLEQRRLELEASGRYYRLTWSNLPAPLELAAVQAELAQDTIAAPLQWRKIVPIALNDGYEFDAGGPFPAERVRVNIDGAGASINTRLYSRPHRSAKWQPRYAGPIYDLRVNGVRFNHSELALARAGERFWRIELPRGSGAAPTLELGWLPHQIVFVGQGKMPYQLAFGRAAALPDRADYSAMIDRLLAQKALATPAKIGPAAELGGAKLLQPERPLPWRKWLVWLALAAGVAALAWMAIRLLRDLATEPQEGMPDDDAAR